jgi:hypothetical protein
VSDRGEDPGALGADRLAWLSWARRSRLAPFVKLATTTAINRVISGSQSDHGFVDAAAAALAQHDRR